MPYTKTVAELSALLGNKSISSVELTQCYLDRIKKHDTDLNGFITVCDESAIQAAKKADERIAKGEVTPLTGIPIAHKDIFCTQGVKTSCGSKMLDNFIAPYDATVVEQLNQAGMVMLGKTNMDEFAMGSSNETSFFGDVKNPWNTDHVPGGSSGGAASVVAARLAPVATGTDTGGSIRQPAALCGITGLKPTYGRVSRFGMIAFASSLDQGGPMTQTAEDAAILLQAMAGFDEKDSTSVDENVPDYQQNLTHSLEGLVAGIPAEYFDERLDPKIKQCMDDAIKVLTDQGVKTKKISLPHTEASIATYYVVAPAECSSNLSRYDGVRFGYRCDAPKDLLDLYQRSRGEAFGDEVKRRIMIGTYVLSAGYYDAYYLKAQKLRRLIRNDFSQAFKEVDFIIGPTSPTAAFKLGDKKDPVSMYLSDVYTLSVNLAGLPAMSLPAGFAEDLPVGVQIIGDYFKEGQLLNIGHQFQKSTDWHQQIPAAYK